ncbi:isoprenyl transferase [uncultured Eubacterium sp.]|mgnify:CR=1 FL=1|uniref:isoprenyl transferase n=1 Tax=uncultured Eubacterium sp. TaxID=165185 RepID=UPI002672052D|nr:isoprenyl transferase [uncultured Eubacterium sp.]
MAQKIDITGLNIPEHVAIILDGNGRWAKKRFLPRNAGHAAGAKNVEKIIEDAHDMGIKYITMYAFSTENWNRPEDEVKALMKLLRNYLKDCIERANKNNMKVSVIGDKTRLDADIIDKINELEACSKENTGIHFIIALNYGSRDEIKRATKKIAEDCKRGIIDIEDISEDLIGRYLDTADVPDPDLLIRTSGEIRLSNYLLWQLAYTEFYFTDVLWPDFDKEELKKAIVKYNQRDRRFGGVKA